MSLFDNEAILSTYEYEIMEKGREEGLEKGLKKGETKKAMETAFNMSKKGYTDETIADLLEVNLNTVKEWISESIQ